MKEIQAHRLGLRSLGVVHKLLGRVGFSDHVAVRRVCVCVVCGRRLQQQIVEDSTHKCGVVIYP